MIAFLLRLPILVYRRVLSPLKPPTCRFVPSCSQYALDALSVWGAFRGSWLALRRILRCHPFTEPGEDPVPPRPAARARRGTG